METLERLPNQEIGLVEKPNGKAVSDVKVWEEKKANFRNDISAYPRKDGNFKVEKADGFAGVFPGMSSGFNMSTLYIVG